MEKKLFSLVSSVTRHISYRHTSHPSQQSPVASVTRHIRPRHISHPSHHSPATLVPVTSVTRNISPLTPQPPVTSVTRLISHPSHQSPVISVIRHVSLQLSCQTLLEEGSLWRRSARRNPENDLQSEQVFEYGNVQIEKYGGMLQMQECDIGLHACMSTASSSRVFISTDLFYSTKNAD